MELSNDIRQVFEQVDHNQNVYVQNLSDAVAIKSISQQKEFRNETIDIVQYFKTVCLVHPKIESPFHSI